jgi:hypothetical protein
MDKDFAARSDAAAALAATDQAQASANKAMAIGTPARTNPSTHFCGNWHLGKASIQVWGDSTTVNGSPDGVFGTQDRRYIGQWVDQLLSSGRLDAVAPAGCGVRIRRFLNGFYNASYLETLRSSSTGTRA